MLNMKDTPLAGHIAKNTPVVRIGEPFIVLAQNRHPRLQVCFSR